MNLSFPNEFFSKSNVPLSNAMNIHQVLDKVFKLQSENRTLVADKKKLREQHAKAIARAKDAADRATGALGGCLAKRNTLERQLTTLREKYQALEKEYRTVVAMRGRYSAQLDRERRLAEALAIELGEAQATIKRLKKDNQ